MLSRKRRDLRIEAVTGVNVDLRAIFDQRFRQLVRVGADAEIAHRIDERDAQL